MDSIGNIVRFAMPIVLSFVFSVLWLWALVDCLLHKPRQGDSKLVWVLVIVFLPPLGALIYFFGVMCRRRTQKTESGISNITLHGTACRRP